MLETHRAPAYLQIVRPLLVFVVLSTVLCHAQAQEDASLFRIRAALLPLRGQPGELDTRGGRPQLTEIKHQLRAWVESRLQDFPAGGDEHTLELRLNAEITSAKLRCSYSETAPKNESCGEGAAISLLGFLADVDLRRPPAVPSKVYLVVTTGVGVVCGKDESAYLYEWTDDRWQLRWQSEQNVYTKEKYRPRAVDTVLVSPRPSGDSLVLSLGHGEWCTSSFNNLYYSLWRTGGSQPKLLLDGFEAGRAWEGSIGGALTATEAAIRYGNMRDDLVIRRYLIGADDSVHRVQPVAFNPQLFAAEWLRRDWAEAREWSEPSVREGLRQQHMAHHKDSLLGGEYPNSTMHCPGSPDLWQVFNEAGYFLIRWKPPYRFTMVRMTNSASPNCNEPDPEADRTILLPR